LKGSFIVASLRVNKKRYEIPREFHILHPNYCRGIIPQIMKYDFAKTGLVKEKALSLTVRDRSTLTNFRNRNTQKSDNETCKF
jgi:hypothetical protein